MLAALRDIGLPTAMCCSFRRSSVSRHEYHVASTFRWDAVQVEMKLGEVEATNNPLHYA